ncbi:MAG: class I SAM-dependent methyltransferase [Actinomycetota bacterium]|nr:class I SAM-dependent methyltransferase [Actinomycetota bacterium]
MSHRDQLIHDYARHYARVNEFVDPSVMSTRDLATMTLNYGFLLEPLRAGSKVLDVGCGTGILLRWLSEHGNVVPVGVDLSPTMVGFARSKLPGIEIACADALDFLRANEKTFDGIFCTDLLEHIPGVEECIAVAEAARAALRPGGFLYCRSPNAGSLTGSYGRYMDLTHERAFTSTSMLQLLDAAGFEKARVVPIRAPHAGGRARLAVEAALHRVVFRICGRGMERVFTSNVCAVGFAPTGPNAGVGS